MVILGLTGSIGMGKSTAAAAFRRLGIPVHDADAAVHRLLAKGGAAVAAVGRLFPKALRDGAIDRQLLGSQVFGRPADLARLEAVLHPLVRRADFVIETGLGKRHALNRLLTIVRLATAKPGRRWPPTARFGKARRP